MFLHILALLLTVGCASYLAWKCGYNRGHEDALASGIDEMFNDPGFKLYDMTLKEIRDMRIYARARGWKP